MPIDIYYADYSGSIRKRAVEVDAGGMVDFKALCGAVVHHPSCVFKFLARKGLQERFGLAKASDGSWRLPSSQAQQLVNSLVGMEEARRGLQMDWRLMSAQDLTTHLIRHGAGRPGPTCQCMECLCGRAMLRKRFGMEVQELNS